MPFGFVWFNCLAFRLPFLLTQIQFLWKSSKLRPEWNFIGGDIARIMTSHSVFYPITFQITHFQYLYRMTHLIRATKTLICVAASKLLEVIGKWNIFKQVHVLGDAKSRSSVSTPYLVLFNRLTVKKAIIYDSSLIGTLLIICFHY